MKQYISHDSYYLGYNIKDFKNDIGYKYILNNKRHGLYLSLSFFNYSLYTYKGYYNMGDRYGHWQIGNNKKFKYYL